MRFTNFQKTIALTAGVLVLSGAIAFVVIAWDGPSNPPPESNAPAPINTGSAAQTKQGDLTVGKLSLNGVGDEGYITNVDKIIGYNDLRLRADTTEQTKIDIGVGDNDVKIYTGGGVDPTITVGADGNLYVPGLADCFLEVDENGKVKCYDGFIPPGGNKLDTSPYISWDVGENECVSQTIGGLEDTVIKAYCYTKVTGPSYGGSHAYCRFYINDILTKTVESHLQYYESGTETNSATWYYNVRPGTAIKICTDSDDSDEEATGQLYKIGSVRADVRYAFVNEGEHILRWYDEGIIGEMEVIGDDYVKEPPASVRISAMNSAEVTYDVGSE